MLEDRLKISKIWNTVWGWLTSTEGKIVIGLILLAAFFRFWGVTHGFPFIFHPDEPAVIRSGIGIRFDPNPAHFDWPHLHFYLNFLLFTVFAKFRGLINYIGLRPILEPAAPLYWRDPLVFYLLSRCLSALMGALTVIPLYLAGKKLVNKTTGILAAITISLMPMHVHASHFALIDVPTAFWIAWVIYFSAGIYKSKKLINYILAGLFVGFAASTKYNGGLAAVTVATAHILRVIKNKEKLFDFEALRNLVISGVVSVLGFLIGTPYALLDWDTFIRNDSPKGALWQFKNVGAVDFTTRVEQFFKAITTAFAEDFGHTIIAGYVMFLIYWVIKHKDKIAWFIAVPSLFLFFYTAGFDKQRTHYYLTVYPFVALAVGYFANFVWGKIQSFDMNKVAKIVLKGLLILALFGLPLALSFDRAWTIAYPDTRVELYGYLENVVSPETHIIYNSSSLEPVMDKFDEEFTHKNVIEENLEERSGYIIIHGHGTEEERQLVSQFRQVLKLEGKDRRGETITVYVF